MAITAISMSDGAPVTYSTHDVDYLADGEDVDQLNTNRPMKNLAARDVVFRDKINEIITILNNAAGTTADVAARLDVEHNPDGTHIGGTFHQAVSIPGGHNYLSVTPLQVLTANVDNPAVPTGGSGLLVAADDVRLLSGRGYVLVASVGGDYLTPKAAIDAGEDKILIGPGTYDDTGGGAINLAIPTRIIGLGNPIWRHAGVTLSAGAEGSLLCSVNFDGANSALTINCNYVFLDKFFSTNVSATYPVTLSSCSYVTLRDVYLTPVAGVTALYASAATYITLIRYYCDGIRSTVALPVVGIHLASACSQWIVTGLYCNCSAVGSTSKDQIAVLFEDGASWMHFEKVLLNYVDHGFRYNSNGPATLEHITIRDVVARDMSTVAVGGTGGHVINFTELSGLASLTINNIYIENVDADAGAETAASICTIGAGTGNIDSVTFNNVRLYTDPSVNYGIYITTTAYISHVHLDNSKFFAGSSFFAWAPPGSILRDISIANTYHDSSGTTASAFHFQGDVNGIFVTNCVNNRPGSALVELRGVASTIKNVTVKGCSLTSKADVLFANNTGGATSYEHITVVGCTVVGATGTPNAIMSLNLGASGTAKYLTVSECTAYGAMYLFEVIASGTDQVLFGAVCGNVIESTNTHTCTASGTHNNQTVNISGNTWKSVTALSSGACFNDAGSNLNHP